MLERVRQLGTLQELVRRADDADAVVALIEGPAGIGKSRLLAAAREMAGAAGFRVLTARGSDLEQEFAFGVCATTSSDPHCPRYCCIVATAVSGGGCLHDVAYTRRQPAASKE